MSGIDVADSERRLQQAKNHKANGEYDEALAVLNELLAVEPDNADVHREIGLIYGFQGLFDESVEALEKAVGLDDSRADILCDLAMTHAMLGMFDEAKPDFEKVLAMDPENKVAQQQMVYFADMAAL